jgi:hypothetical protein
MTAALLEVKAGYRIERENGAFVPQRLNKAGEWVGYSDMQYGRRFTITFKTQRGAANFLDLQWWMDTPFDEQEKLLKSGNVSDQILKKLGLKRKVK